MQYNITYRQKDGGIQFIISFKDKNGKWRQRSRQGYKKKGDAKKAADKMLDKLKKEFTLQLNTELEGITFGEFTKIFIKHIKIYKETNTVALYQQAIKKFSKLNEIALEKITPLHVQERVDEMVAAGLEVTTIKLYVTQLKITFNNAIKTYKIIVDNPVIDIKIPSQKKEPKLKALNLSDMENLLASIKTPRHYVATMIAGKCGLRIGEIIGLTWSDVDFVKCKIDVNKQWKLLKSGEYGFGSLKSKTSYRIVPASQSVLQVLKNYKKTFPTSIDGRILPYKSTNGTSSTLAKRYKKLGYDISIHDLRHTFATLLIANGTDFRTAAQILGHALEETIRTYSHVTSDMMERAAKTIENIFD